MEGGGVFKRGLLLLSFLNQKTPGVFTGGLTAALLIRQNRRKAVPLFVYSSYRWRPFPRAWSLLRASKRVSSVLFFRLWLAASRPLLLAFSSSSPLRGSTRARAAGDRRDRSGLPVPDTGQTRVPR